MYNWNKYISSEFEEQKKLIEWASFNKELNDYIFSIPNGGSRNIIEAMNLKRTGVKSGIPDMFIAIPNGKYHGMFIEMKRIGGKPTKNQAKYLELFMDKGYYCVICEGFLEAKKEIEYYLKKF